LFQDIAGMTAAVDRISALESPAMQKGAEKFPLLDFCNPKVRAYLIRLIAKIVSKYGIGYIKTDYNVNSLQGIEHCEG
jgi:uncharacterized lipoprotein YddW (UPF0748 family)